VSKTAARATASAAGKVARCIPLSSAGAFLILSTLATAPLRRVLVVDDDDDIRLLLGELLRGAGYAVETAKDGRDALRTFHANPADLVVLDLSMPELDGFETLERLRDLSDVPVILLTARGGEIDKVRGFRAGADDYVVKPFGRRELLARIEALLRRAPEPKHLDHYDDGAVSIDYGRRHVMSRGVLVRLTPLEFRLLCTLVEHAGNVLSADQLVEHVWGHAAGVSTDQVKLYVSYLRKKLGQEAEGFEPIETLRGFGYRYVPPSA
jgi:DNA-binding response OmpR family regulator